MKSTPNELEGWMIKNKTDGCRDDVWAVCFPRFLFQFEHRLPLSERGCSFFSFVRLFLYVNSLEGRKEASPPFEARDGHSRKVGLPDIRCVHVGTDLRGWSLSAVSQSQTF